MIQTVHDYYAREIPAIIVSGDPSVAKDMMIGGRRVKILQKPIRGARLRTLIHPAHKRGS